MANHHQFLCNLAIVDVVAQNKKKKTNKIKNINKRDEKNEHKNMNSV